jgi:thiosulfate/3-mercaptopyruvate sulfurtransferase
MSKMKPDITSRYGNLSRKIRGLIPALFFGILIGVSSESIAETEHNKGLLVTAEQIRSLPLKELTIIDTRSKWKYFLGHIPGAVNLPDWRDFTNKKEGVPGMLIEDPEWIVEKLRPLGIDSKKTLVLYGDPRDKWRTDGRFFWMFERYGFPAVKILDGGLDQWQKSGGSVERGRGKTPSPSKLSSKDIQLNPDVIADQAWIHSRLESGNIAIIDNRTRDEYDGAIPYGSERGGHIPHATHIHWSEFFDDDGSIKNVTKLTELIDKYGLRRDQEIVVYCTGGVRSAMAFFVLKYLGYRVRNYDGSWWDWSHNPALPIEVS